MANREHLRILKRGVKAWNAWREQNRGIRPQTSQKSPLRIWGAKPTVPAVEHFDEQPCGATAE
jgi:hypothetical protein